MLLSQRTSLMKKLLPLKLHSTKREFSKLFSSVLPSKSFDGEYSYLIVIYLQFLVKGGEFAENYLVLIVEILRLWLDCWRCFCWNWYVCHFVFESLIWRSGLKKKKKTMKTKKLLWRLMFNVNVYFYVWSYGQLLLDCNARVLRRLWLKYVLTVFSYFEL